MEYNDVFYHINTGGNGRKRIYIGKPDYTLWAFQVLVVAKTYQSILRQLREDQSPRRNIPRIETEMSNVED